MTKNLNYLKPLEIIATGDTPEVFLRATETSSLSGRSLPENAYVFYEPILDWIKQLVDSDTKEFTLVFSFDYFNSSSGRYIYEILHLLDKSRNKNHYSITWKYETEDDLMIERGESFQALCSIPFSFVETKRD